MSTTISFENVSKCYRLGVVGAGTLRGDVSRWWAKFRNQPDPLAVIGEVGSTRRKGDEFWALRGVDFDVQQGEVLGVIGRNGAGKSTLLKILSRVTAPTSGRIGIRGHIASLLEIGTGFHPELTGRENIYLNGAILGMRKSEISRKIDEIVAFAEIEEFLDTPVKRYSSGMYVRLAFAVAAHLEPDILVVDEVLAVGDSGFQKKCLGKLQDVSRSHGRTVLFVSHNMSAVAALCTRALLLQDGAVAFHGPKDLAISKYLEESSKGFRNGWRRETTPPDKSLVFMSASCVLTGAQPDVRLEVKVALQSLKPHKPAMLAINIASTLGVNIGQSLPSAVPIIDFQTGIRTYLIRIHLPGIVPGIYSIRCWAGPHYTETYDDVIEAAYFEVADSPTPDRSMPFTPLDNGFIVPRSTLHQCIS